VAMATVPVDAISAATAAQRRVRFMARGYVRVAQPDARIQRLV